MNQNANSLPRVIGFDSHPDTFTAALLRGQTPAQALTEKTFNQVPMAQLQSWARKHTRPQDVFVLEGRHPRQIRAVPHNKPHDCYVLRVSVIWSACHCYKTQ